MQKTIEAWWKRSGMHGDGYLARRRGQDGLAGRIEKMRSRHRGRRKLEKAMEQRKVDLDRCEIPIAKKGLSTQTAMQRMTHALADKTGLTH